GVDHPEDPLDAGLRLVRLLQVAVEPVEEDRRADPHDARQDVRPADDEVEPLAEDRSHSAAGTTTGAERGTMGPMSEGIDLPAVPRGTLLSEAERAARVDAAAPQILAAVEGESDPIVVQATLACLLWETLPQASWVGFYRRVRAGELAVGPYQGTMGCLRIALERGVC